MAAVMHSILNNVIPAKAGIHRAASAMRHRGSRLSPG